MKALLFKYYKKKVRPILTIIENQDHGLEMEDIHQLRVNIKKVRSVFNLIEILSPKDFKTQRDDIFNAVFKKAGKIRELQINRNILNQYKINPSNTALYRQYENHQEKKSTKEFKKTVDDFNLSQLKKINEKIKLVGEKTNHKKIILKSYKFITGKAQKIKKLTSKVDNPEKVHKLRMHMKSIDAIAALLFQMEQNENLKKLLVSVKQAGDILGAWHDKEVLADSLENFIEKRQKGTSKKFPPLKKLVNRIKIENQQLFKKSIPKINAVLEKIPANSP